jgi:hypothetical protein
MKTIKKTFILFMIISFILLTTACAADAVQQPLITDETILIEPVDSRDISGIETKPLGIEVETGEITWNIKEAQDRGSSVVATDFTFEAVVGKIIILEFTVINNSEDSRILYDLNIIDDQGRVFSICLPAYGLLSIEKACALQEIVPGIEYVFAAPFDVGVDSKGMVLEITDLKTPYEDYAYVDLGI